MDAAWNGSSYLCRRTESSTWVLLGTEAVPSVGEQNKINMVNMMVDIFTLYWLTFE